MRAQFLKKDVRERQSLHSRVRDNKTLRNANLNRTLVATAHPPEISFSVICRKPSFYHFFNCLMAGSKTILRRDEMGVSPANKCPKNDGEMTKKLEDLKDILYRNNEPG